MSVETPYQKLVNDMTGAMGPYGDAIYPFQTVSNPWSLGNQPLQLFGNKYIAAVDVNAASSLPVLESIPVGSAFGRRKSRRGSKKSSKKSHRKSKRTHKKAKKSHRKSKRTHKKAKKSHRKSSK